MKNFYTFAFTHHNVGLDQIGEYHLVKESFDDEKKQLLKSLTEEFLFISTCNRVEFWFRSNQEAESIFLKNLLQCLYPAQSTSFISSSVDSGELISGISAVERSFEVASSLNSLVIGEREILTQIREAFATSQELGLTGDFLRILINKTVETAKKVFTQTEISNKPVSVVNLAYRKLMDLNPSVDARILVLGSGRTNQALTLKMKKHGFSNFSVFNRTLTNAESLAKTINGESFGLSDLLSYEKGFDIMLACTGSSEPIITRDVFKSLLQGDSPSGKIVVDLAMPREISAEMVNEFQLRFLGVESLKEIAEQNMKSRKAEIHHCKAIVANQVRTFLKTYKARQVELAMREVPQKMKEIKTTAMNEVFADELAKLDQESKEVLDKVVSYLEKKYLGTPMLMAKEILLKEEVR